MTELHGELSRLANGKDLANELIEKWVESFNPDEACIEPDDNPFSNPLHPRIKEALDKVLVQRQARMSVVEASNHIIVHSGWGAMQRVAMQRASTDDFESAIRSLDADGLRTFMRHMITIVLRRKDYDQHFGQATDRFMDACRRIVNQPRGKSDRLPQVIRRSFEKTSLATELDQEK